MSDLDEKAVKAAFDTYRNFGWRTPQGMEKAIRAYLAAAPASAPAPTVSGEAVAWRVRPMPGFAWVYVEGDPDRNPALRDYEKQPVYVHPSPTRAEVLEKVNEHELFNNWWAMEQAGGGFPLTVKNVAFAAWCARRALAGEKP